MLNALDGEGNKELFLDIAFRSGVDYATGRYAYSLAAVYFASDCDRLISETLAFEDSEVLKGLMPEEGLSCDNPEEVVSQLTAVLDVPASTTQLANALIIIRHIKGIPLSIETREKLKAFAATHPEPQIALLALDILGSAPFHGMDHGMDRREGTRDAAKIALSTRQNPSLDFVVSAIEMSRAEPMSSEDLRFLIDFGLQANDENAVYTLSCLRWGVGKGVVISRDVAVRVTNRLANILLSPQASEEIKVDAGYTYLQLIEEEGYAYSKSKLTRLLLSPDEQVQEVAFRLMTGYPLHPVPAQKVLENCQWMFSLGNIGLQLRVCGELGAIAEEQIETTDAEGAKIYMYTPEAYTAAKRLANIAFYGKNSQVKEEALRIMSCSLSSAIAETVGEISQQNPDPARRLEALQILAERGKGTMFNEIEKRYLAQAFKEDSTPANRTFAGETLASADSSAGTYMNFTDYEIALEIVEVLDDPDSAYRIVAAHVLKDFGYELGKQYAQVKEAPPFYPPDIREYREKTESFKAILLEKREAETVPEVQEELLDAYLAVDSGYADQEMETRSMEKRDLMEKWNKEGIIY